MRIIHVVVSDRSRWSIGGDERYVLSLATAQQAQGFNIAIVTNSDEGLFTEVCREQGMQVIVTSRFVLPDKKSSLDLGADLVREFTEFRPDIIHCHDAPTVWALAASNDMGIPCILTPHAPVTGPLHHLGTARKFATICVWKSTMRTLKEYGMSGSELYYVPCGTKGSSYMYPYEVFDSKPNLMIVGRLVQEKGIHTALFAMVELRKRHGRECPGLDLYGGGPMLEYFKETASILGLDGIARFHGVQFDVLNHCPGSNILVMPSAAETGPLVVLEAMSRGMPIVATRVGDVAEMLPDQRYGRLVPRESIMMLADAIDETLSDVANFRFDPGLLIERHRKLYTVEKMAEGIGSVYSQILNRSPSATTVSRSYS